MRLDKKARSKRRSGLLAREKISQLSANGLLGYDLDEVNEDWDSSEDLQVHDRKRRKRVMLSTADAYESPPQTSGKDRSQHMGSSIPETPTSKRRQRGIATPPYTPTPCEQRHAWTNASFESTKLVRSDLESDVQPEVERLSNRLEAQAQRYLDLQAKDKEISQLKSKLATAQTRLLLSQAEMATLKAAHPTNSDSIITDLNKRIAEQNTQLNLVCGKDGFQIIKLQAKIRVLEAQLSEQHADTSDIEMHNADDRAQTPRQRRELGGRVRWCCSGQMAETSDMLHPTTTPKSMARSSTNRFSLPSTPAQTRPLPLNNSLTVLDGAIAPYGLRRNSAATEGQSYDPFAGITTVDLTAADE